MTEYFYPERMVRIILLAMEEVIGRDGLHSVLDHSSLASYAEEPLAAASEKTLPFRTVTRLQESLEQVYGLPGGRGTAVRIGRACFQYGLREYGSMLGITEIAFRLLPLSTKLHAGARLFADLFNRQTDQRVRIEDKDNQLLWHIERCPLCWERRTAEPVCQLAVGLLQEALFWLSGGKIFSVEEVACIARGDPACTIVIDRTPLA
ncbi:MAG TPA: 4-vinyl reductase [Anaerolineales bacterium]|nr:4-vinyl reductase [Anaerolineales bacterium]